jgi:hypothetical protein
LGVHERLRLCPSILALKRAAGSCHISAYSTGTVPVPCTGPVLPPESCLNLIYEITSFKALCGAKCGTAAPTYVLYFKNSIERERGCRHRQYQSLIPGPVPGFGSWCTSRSTSYSLVHLKRFISGNIMQRGTSCSLVHFHSSAELKFIYFCSCIFWFQSPQRTNVPSCSFTQKRNTANALPLLPGTVLSA